MLPIGKWIYYKDSQAFDVTLSWRLLGDGGPGPRLSGVYDFPYS